MVGRIAGYVFKKPVGRNKSVGLFFRRKFHFCDNKRCEGVEENIQLNRIGLQRDEITAFAYDIAVRLFD